MLPLLILPVATYLELFHPGGRKQKPSEDEDVGILKKPKLEEGKGFMYIHIYSSGISCLLLMSVMVQVLLLKHGSSHSPGMSATLWPIVSTLINQGQHI